MPAPIRASTQIRYGSVIPENLADMPPGTVLGNPDPNNAGTPEAILISSLADKSIFEDIKDPTGWVNPPSIVVSYDHVARTITLNGDLTYYWNGTKHVLTAPWVSDAHAEGDATYFLYSTDGETFSWSTTPWEFFHLMVSLAMTSVSPSYQLAIREVHGTMDWQVHKELHRRISSDRSSGGILTPGTYAEDTATDAATTPGFDSAVINDEDIETTVALLPEGTYTTLRVGAGDKATFDTTSGFPFRYAPGGFILVNNPSTGGEAEAATNRFLNVYQILIPVASDTESQKYRMVFLQPQIAYTSLAGALAEDTRQLKLGDLSGKLPEFVIFARITFSAGAGNANTGKVKIALGGVTYVFGSRQEQLSVGGFTPTSAANVSVSPAGNIEATNVQAALEELDAEKLSGVTTDVSLTGSGTLLSPLSVVRFVHDQSSPADIWPVTHNLGRNPAVVVVDSSGRVVYGGIEYINPNEIIITFSAAFSGKAHLT